MTKAIIICVLTYFGIHLLKVHFGAEKALLISQAVTTGFLFALVKKERDE